MNASDRPNTCKSRGSRVAIPLATGARVRNAYGTWPTLRDSLPKGRLIPYVICLLHDRYMKDLLV